jgi:hypothetical protein
MRVWVNYRRDRGRRGRPLRWDEVEIDPEVVARFLTKSKEEGGNDLPHHRDSYVGEDGQPIYWPTCCSECNYEPCLHHREGDYDGALPTIYQLGAEGMTEALVGVPLSWIECCDAGRAQVEQGHKAWLYENLVRLADEAGYCLVKIPERAISLRRVIRCEDKPSPRGEEVEMASIKTLPLLNTPANRKWERKLLAEERAKREPLLEECRRKYAEYDQRPENVAYRAKREKEEARARFERANEICPVCRQTLPWEQTRSYRRFQKLMAKDFPEEDEKIEAEIEAELDAEDMPLSRRVLRTEDKEVNKK